MPMQSVKWIVVIPIIQTAYGTSANPPGPQPSGFVGCPAGRASRHPGRSAAGPVAAGSLGPAQAVAGCVRRSPARSDAGAWHDAYCPCRGAARTASGTAGRHPRPACQRPTLRSAHGARALPHCGDRCHPQHRDDAPGLAAAGAGPSLPSGHASGRPARHCRAACHRRAGPVVAHPGSHSPCAACTQAVRRELPLRAAQGASRRPAAPGPRHVLRALPCHGVTSGRRVRRGRRRCPRGVGPTPERAGFAP